MLFFFIYYIFYCIYVYCFIIKCYYRFFWVFEDVKVVREKGMKGRSEILGGWYDLMVWGGIVVGDGRGKG